MSESYRGHSVDPAAELAGDELAAAARELGMIDELDPDAPAGMTARQVARLAELRGGDQIRPEDAVELAELESLALPQQPQEVDDAGD